MDELALFARWGFDERGWKPKTRQDYGQYVARALRWFAARDLELAAAELPRLKEFVFSTKAAATTRNRLRAALVGYFSFVVATGRRPDNPSERLARLPEHKGIPKPLTAAQVPLVLAAAAGYSPLFGTFVVLKLHTGLRISELLGLRWEQVAGDWAYLVQKGGQTRAVFLNTAARAALDLWAASELPSEWVFPSPKVPGAHISRGWVETKLKALAADAGVEGFHPHRLRHTFGSSLYRETRDLPLVQRAMGHASITSTTIYARAEDPEVAEAVRRLHY